MDAVGLGCLREMKMAKANLASMSVVSLLKLRDDIGNVLSRRANDLQRQLSRLSGEIGSGKRRRRSSLKVERPRSNIATRQAISGQEEERSPFGCEKS